MLLTQDSQCLISDNTATATDAEWKTKYSQGEEFFKEGESMFEQAQAAVSKVKKEAVSGKFTEAQTKALTEAVTCMATAQGNYMAAEKLFKDSRAMFNQEVNKVRREAKKQRRAVPESVEEFGKQLDDITKVAGARAQYLDGVLRSLENKVH